MMRFQAHPLPLQNHQRTVLAGFLNINRAEPTL